MTLLTKHQFQELATVHGAHCVSIYMPAQRYGAEIKKGKLRIAFEQRLREVRQELEERGLKARETELFLAPAYELAEDSGFWTRLSDGLAVFIGEQFFQYFTLPVRFESYHYIADHFYLRPLLPMFNGDGRFFILGLTLHGAQFYEGFRHEITEIFVDDLTPARLEEVVGFDFEQRAMQFRSFRSGDSGHGMVSHGHGSTNEKRKDEILQFCRAVDKGLMKILYDLKAPLVVVSVDFLFPIYKEANTYKHLVANRHVAGQPEYMDLQELHERAWEVVEPIFAQTRREKLRLYDEFRHTSRTAYELADIVPAAIHGRIDTLFLQTRQDAYGLYEPAGNVVIVDEAKTPGNASLLNLAAVRTFLQDGQVFLLEPEEMPEADTLANAVMRY